MKVCSEYNFHQIGPLGRFGLVVHVHVRLFFFKASHWPSNPMIRFRTLIGLSELSILDENSEEVHNLQSLYGLLDENAEEVHNLHHNLQSTDGLLDENSEEVHNLQSHDGLLDENAE